MKIRSTIFFSMISVVVLHGNVDFDSSMQIEAYPDVMCFQNCVQAMDVFRDLYKKNNPFRILPSSTLKIPKIIHQIWLGGTLPVEYHEFRKSWITHHPAWTFIFWTDNPENYEQGDLLIETFDKLVKFLYSSHRKTQFVVVDVAKLAFENRGFYDRAHNYGEKSDILKWEIVYRFGGLYVDTDYECLKPHDEFHYMYDFYTGIQPLDTNIVQLGAALYGGRPGHPIMKECVEKIKKNQHIRQIIIKTGPLHFTNVFLNKAGQNENIDVALPATFFYPCGYNQKGQDASVWQRPESYAIHHWAGSWLKPEAFETRKK